MRVVLLSVALTPVLIAGPAVADCGPVGFDHVRYWRIVTPRESLPYPARVRYLLIDLGQGTRLALREERPGLSERAAYASADRQRCAVVFPTSGGRQVVLASDDGGRHFLLRIQHPSDMDGRSLRRWGTPSFAAADSGLTRYESWWPDMHWQRSLVSSDLGRTWRLQPESLRWRAFGNLPDHDVPTLAERSQASLAPAGCFLLPLRPGALLRLDDYRIWTFGSGLQRCPD